MSILTLMLSVPLFTFAMEETYRHCVRDFHLLLPLGYCFHRFTLGRNSTSTPPHFLSPVGALGSPNSLDTLAQSRIDVGQNRPRQETIQVAL